MMKLLLRLMVQQNAMYVSHLVFHVPRLQQHALSVNMGTISIIVRALQIVHHFSHHMGIMKNQ